MGTIHRAEGRMKRDAERELFIAYSKKEKDIMIHYPRKCGGWLIHDYFSDEVLEYDYPAFCQGSQKPYTVRKSLIDELKERGYDIETIKFSIKLKKS